MPLRPAGGAASRARAQPVTGERAASGSRDTPEGRAPAQGAFRPRASAPAVDPDPARRLRAPVLALYEANQAGWPAAGHRIDLYA
ncbi:MAG: hypothetical protein Fur0039_15880 [Rhodocyclaceae bacterium]